MPTSAPLQCNDDDNNGRDDNDDENELSEKCLLYFDFGALIFSSSKQVVPSLEDMDRKNICGC